jgi:hypothetical protein
MMLAANPAGVCCRDHSRIARECVAFLRGRLRRRMAKSLEQVGDRVIYASKNGTPFGRIEEFFEILND